MERSAIANGVAAALPEMLTHAPRRAGKLRREGEHHHAAERGTDDGVEALDAQRAHHLVAAARDVLDRQIREA